MSAMRNDKEAREVAGLVGIVDPAVAPGQTGARGALEAGQGAPPPSPPFPHGRGAGRLALGLAALAAVLWLGAQLGPPLGSAWRSLRQSVAGGGGTGAQPGESGPHYYTCGMHPWVILPRPGICPICEMKLTPLDPARFSGEVSINPVVAQNIGVRVEEVTRGPLASTIRTAGIVAYDETKVADVNLKVEGWIEKLHVDFLGARVKQGQPLFELYSPDLYAAEEEYLLALRARKATDGGAAELVQAARRKLAYLDVGPAQIAELERRGRASKTMTIRSPYPGFVTEKHAFAGMKVTPGKTAYRIADLSEVWVIATLYEYQSQAVQVGQPATMTLSYDPGKELKGKVVYIYPYLDQQTRQINVRLEFPNPDLALKPGMFATVELQAGAAAPERVLVSRSAVIDTGERQVAFVSLGDGRFEPRTVRMGGEAGDGKVEILDGLNPGELVVVSGQFLIDSEARMREALARMMKGTPAVQPEAPPRPVAAAVQEAVPLPAPAAAALAEALEAYLAIGDALASDTTRDIGVAARQLVEAVQALVGVELPGRPHVWHEHREAEELARQAQAMARPGTLDEARRDYAPLSAALAGLLRLTGVPASFGAQLEQLQCPMYPEGSSGSVWLQRAGEARNPYFGSVMLRCFDTRQPLPSAVASGRAERFDLAPPEQHHER